MANLGDNNPRAFGDAVSLDAWRTRYDENSGEADLHVNVVFSDGRVGGGIGSPVRFRLQLLRADVHVVRDSASVLKISPSSVLTPNASPIERTAKTSLETEHAGQARLSLGTASSAEFAGGRKHVVRQEVVETGAAAIMKFVSMKTPEGYLFRIEQVPDAPLSGSPWSPSTSVLTMKDPKAPRTNGEPPELRIELRCRREDMHITDIQITENGRNVLVSPNKMLAVEQYINQNY
ncbi:hypothetical protein [Devosia sp.]|uniref:hypothetical protein n=1 Tax=Devosia sp. TaxID=1871048 RepID=UPI00273348D4|nr:hypothetical protein [Devosia sp.]MDP2780748.1 hypothetical protein [Devosia sp.]